MLSWNEASDHIDVSPACDANLRLRGRVYIFYLLYFLHLHCEDISKSF